MNLGVLKNLLVRSWTIALSSHSTPRSLLVSFPINYPLNLSPRLTSELPIDPRYLRSIPSLPASSTRILVATSTPRSHSIVLESKSFYNLISRVQMSGSRDTSVFMSSALSSVPSSMTSTIQTGGSAWRWWG